MAKKLAKRSKEEKQETKTPKIKIDGMSVPIDVSHMVSTGSTLLDLSISGKRKRGGGFPGGILVEIFGRSGSGKTAILTETAASTQYSGGDIRFLDPEDRLDEEYARLYGMELSKENLYKPKYISELFNLINNWNPSPEYINTIAADSLAAFSTETEMESGDKRGQMRAKAFSEGTRKMALKIGEENKLIICSNQIRQGDYGDITPGGQAVPFYSSVRIRIKQTEKIEKQRSLKRKIVDSKGKEKTKSGSAVKKVIGIWSECELVKNSVDDPFRKAPIRLIFGHGIDDIGANIHWLKTVKGDDTFYKGYKDYESAIAYVENEDLEDELREEVITTWEEIENLFNQNRKPKKRFIL